MANGGNVEKLNYKIDFSNSGTFYNVTLDKSNKTIKLNHLEDDGNGLPIYAEEGYWLSDIIDLKDIFADFEIANIVSQNDSTSTMKVLTRVSNDGVAFDEWVELSSSNLIQSATRRYIQFKITFNAGFIRDKFLIADFEKEEDVELFDNNHLLVSDKTLRIKNNFEYEMDLEASTSEEYDYYRFKVDRKKWTKINYISVREGYSE